MVTDELCVLLDPRVRRTCGHQVGKALHEDQSGEIG